MGTPRTLAKRAYDICSINEHLQNELSHIKKNSQEQNQYPLWATNEVFCKIKWYNNQQLQEKHQLPTTSPHQELSNSKKYFLFLPHKRKKVDNIIKSMKKTVQKLLTESVNTQIGYAEWWRCYGVSLGSYTGQYICGWNSTFCNTLSF